MNNRFRLLIVSGVVGVIMITIGSSALVSGRLTATSQTAQQVFTGLDGKGDFQSALRDAVAKAQQAAGCCDILVTYQVIDVQGRIGGFTGEDEIQVTILARWPK